MVPPQSLPSNKTVLTMQSHSMPWNAQIDWLLTPSSYSENLGVSITALYNAKEKDSSSTFGLG